MGAYYYWAQNSYLTAANATCQTVTNGYATKPLNGGVGRQIAGHCSGEFNQGSFLIVYTLLFFALFKERLALFASLKESLPNRAPALEKIL